MATESHLNKENTECVEPGASRNKKKTEREK
jgi:hypothetical protein